MALISIAGIAPGIGKTAVAELLLARLGGWRVARVCVADEIAGEEAARVGERGYALLAEAEATGRREVRRLVEAGGRAPAVLLAEARGLEEGVRALLSALPPHANLLVEGNAFLWARRADLAIMVVGPGASGRGLAPVRPSVREVFPRIGLWVWNTRTRPADEGFFEFPQALVRMGFVGAVSNAADFHHVNPAVRSHGGNAPFVEAVRNRLAAARKRRRAPFSGGLDRPRGP